MRAKISDCVLRQTCKAIFASVQLCLEIDDSNPAAIGMKHLGMSVAVL
jgi:uncharacterized protein (UPF0261 family)